MILRLLITTLFIVSAATGTDLPYDEAALKYAILGKETSFGKNIKEGLDGEVGPYQIKALAVIDVNRHYGTRYTHEDCNDFTKGWGIAVMYMNKWATMERMGHAPTIRDKVLAFHYGPSYRKGNLTDRDNYWPGAREIYIKLIQYDKPIKTIRHEKSNSKHTDKKR